MTINLKIALIAITLIYMFLVLKEIRSKKLKLSFAIFWIISGIMLIVAIMTPNLIESLTKLLGFEVPSNMLFCITIFTAFYLIFNLTVKLSKEYQNNVTIVQEISLLKNRVEELERRKEEKEKIAND